MEDIYLTLVNENNAFDKSVLDDLKMVSVKDSDGKTYIEEKTFKAFEKLKKVMNEKHSIALSLTSAGRTVETQQKVYEEIKKQQGQKAADELVATPGKSEHHLGLALDVGVHKISSPIEQKLYNSQTLKKVGSKIRRVTKEERAEMYKKLHAELADLGFVVRYPEDKKDITKIKRPEPWHIRFVGIENAKEMKKLDMCLEEYVEYLKEQELSI